MVCPNTVISTGRLHRGYLKSGQILNQNNIAVIGGWRLVVNPYPKKYETSWKLRDGRTVMLRTIKPEDAPLWLEMFRKFSEESKRYRFFQIIKDTPSEK